MLTVKGNLSARSKRRCSRSSCYSEKKGPRLWSNEFYSTGSWRIGIERFGETHLKLSGCTWYKIEVGKEKGILEALSKKVNLMSEILARLFLRRNHQRKPHDKQGKVAWKLARKTWKLKAEDKATFYSPVERKGARDTEDRTFIVYSGASTHNAEQRRIELRYNGYFEKVQNSTCDLPRPGAVQINE